MSGLLRRMATRPLARMPLRGGDHLEKIVPISSNFPLTHEKTMGPHGWCRGSYTFWGLGQNAIVGPLYRPPWVVGGIHNPTIDANKHFNTQDRFETLSAFDFIRCWLWPFMAARTQIIQVLIPVIAVLMVTWLEQRREPMEIFMDREEYWKDYNSYMYGVYFDHHHFSHMLCHRRANKWGYHDVTLADGHH